MGARINVVTLSDRGIHAGVNGSSSIRNVAKLNTTSDDIAASNAVGQILKEAGRGSFENTDPTASFVS